MNLSKILIISLFQSVFKFYKAVSFLDLDCPSVNGKSIVRDISCNCCSGGCVNSFSELYRGNKVCVTADKAVVADNASALYNSVIVYSYSTATEVNLLADIAVANVSEVSNSCTFTDNGVLDFNEVTDFNAALDMAARTDMYPWAYLYTCVNG